MARLVCAGAVLAATMVVLSVQLMVVPTVDAAANPLARGWGDSYQWYNLQDGLKAAQRYGKPIMLIIHKSWCGACQALKPQIADSASIMQLAKEFVMVNVEDDEEPEGPEYRPDGGYIPRILFLEKNGRVRADIVNPEGNPNYKFYYSSASQLLSGMAHALHQVRMSTAAEPQTEEL